MNRGDRHRVCYITTRVPTARGLRVSVLFFCEWPAISGPIILTGLQVLLSSSRALSKHEI